MLIVTYFCFIYNSNINKAKVNIWKIDSLLLITIEMVILLSQSIMFNEFCFILMITCQIFGFSKGVSQNGCCFLKNLIIRTLKA